MSAASRIQLQKMANKSQAGMTKVDVSSLFGKQQQERSGGSNAALPGGRPNAGGGASGNLGAGGVNPGASLLMKLKAGTSAQTSHIGGVVSGAQGDGRGATS